MFGKICAGVITASIVGSCYYITKTTVKVLDEMEKDYCNPDLKTFLADFNRRFDAKFC